MISTEQILLITAAAVFVIASVLGVFARTKKAAGVLLVAGTALDLAALIVRAVVSGHAPLSNQYESLLFTAFCTGMILVILLRRGAHRGMVFPLLPLLAAVQLVTVVFYTGPSPLVPVLRSWWLAVHVIIVMAAYACLLVSFGYCVLFLLARAGKVLKDTADPEKLEEVGYRLVTFGYPLLLAGILTGAVWAKQAWGRYWGWDPKETWALITWLLYTVYLHNRLKGRQSARVTAWLNIIAFLCVIFTYFGVNYLLAGLHSYAR